MDLFDTTCPFYLADLHRQARLRNDVAECHRIQLEVARLSIDKQIIVYRLKYFQPIKKMENIILVTESQLKQIVKDAIRECFGTHNFSTENQTVNQKIQLPNYLPDDTEIRDLGYIINRKELSIRTFNCILAAKINTLGELRAVPIEIFRSYRNVGQKSVNEVIALLEKYGK